MHTHKHTRKTQYPSYFQGWISKAGTFQEKIANESAAALQGMSSPWQVLTTTSTHLAAKLLYTRKLYRAVVVSPHLAHPRQSSHVSSDWIRIGAGQPGLLVHAKTCAVSVCMCLPRARTHTAMPHRWGNCIV